LDTQFLRVRHAGLRADTTKVVLQVAKVKAREWHDRGKRADDPIDAFSNFWRAFNNLYSPLHANQERDKIRLLLGKQISEAKAQELITAHAVGVDYLISQPVIDMRGKGHDTKPNIKAFHAGTASLGRLQELFMIIYQVRCNLEHGQKSPKRKRDIELCQYAGPIVAAVVKLCA
jgi:hypothetical protein